MAFTILIIDDHETTAKIFAKLLKSLGHKILLASSGEIGLKVLKEKKPKIVLLDIDMPKMNGYQVARKIKKSKKLAQTILVALTGHGKKEDKLRASKAGFNHHIEKPASLADIKRIIDIYEY